VLHYDYGRAYNLATRLLDVNTMVQKKLTPLALCVSRFRDAGVSGRQLGVLLGKSQSYICQLTIRGGHVPNTNGMHSKWLELARAKKVKLSADELIYGGML
jgi:hypothetical protein